MLLPHWLLLGSSVLFLLARACDHHEEHVRDGLRDGHHPHGSSIARRGLQEDPEDEPEVCGTEEPTEDEAQAETEQLAEWQGLAGRDYLPPQSYWIPTYFHVIQTEEVESDKEITEERVLYYVDYLNNAFRESVFFFNIRGISWAKNTYWADNGRIEDVELDFKRSRKRGGMESLNIYLVNKLPPPDGQGAYWVGFAFLPSSNAATGAKDGCVVTRSQAVPGNDQRPNTLVHEVVSAFACWLAEEILVWALSLASRSHTRLPTQNFVSGWLLLLLNETKQQQQGHWLGLLHTFAGNCDGNHLGDRVDDTPAHIAGGLNCDDACCFGDSWDSCPDLDGIDPVE